MRELHANVGLLKNIKFSIGVSINDCLYARKQFLKYITSCKLEYSKISYI